MNGSRYVGWGLRPAAARGDTPAQSYARFARQNPAHGMLKAQAYAGERIYPVANVRVDISRKFPAGIYAIDAQWTDISGLTEPVALPVQPAANSKTPGQWEPYTSYDVTFSHPGYTTVIVHNVEVFEGITSLQFMEMIPRGAAPGGREVVEYNAGASPRRCE